MLSARDAVALYDLLGQYDVRCWLVGGWGVDALLGRQTRPHKDLDVLVTRQDLPRLRQLCHEHGFVRTVVWEENRWVIESGHPEPTAFVLADEQGRELDVHVLEIGPDEDVTALWELPWRFQARFLQGRGQIGTTLVDCVTVAVQLLMHTGYALPDSHARDVELLERAQSAGHPSPVDSLSTEATPRQPDSPVLRDGRPQAEPPSR